MQMFASPEKAIVKHEGRDLTSLRKLAILLARGCFFGDDVMVNSSPVSFNFRENTCMLIAMSKVATSIP